MAVMSTDNIGFDDLRGMEGLNGTDGLNRMEGLPDENFLQQLANRFFQTPPVPAASVGGIPSSVAGSGISPSAVNQGNSVDLKDPQTSLPDPHFAGKGLVPSSVAGSGK